MFSISTQKREDPKKSPIAPHLSSHAENHPFNTERRAAYLRADRLCPRARDRELTPILERAHRLGGPALDLGSGLGYVVRKLLKISSPVDTVDYSFDKVPGVRDHLKVDLTRGLPPSLPGSSYQLITSLASMHHIAQGEGILPTLLAESLTKAIKPHGEFILIDVPSRESVSFLKELPHSREAALTSSFFQDIVDPLSNPDHNGTYLNFSALSLQLSALQWTEESLHWITCPWNFPDRDNAYEYIKGIFNLKARSPMEERLLKEAMDLRLEECPQGLCFKWGLGCLVMKYQPEPSR